MPKDTTDYNLVPGRLYSWRGSLKDHLMFIMPLTPLPNGGWTLLFIDYESTYLTSTVKVTKDDYLNSVSDLFVGEVD